MDTTRFFQAIFLPVRIQKSSSSGFHSCIQPGFIQLAAVSDPGELIRLTSFRSLGESEAQPSGPLSPATLHHVLQAAG